MQIVSAYLLAASAVDSGNYDEDYDIGIDPSFEEYMDIAGADIVGEYIDLDVPTGGTSEGNFDGTKFCDDWVASFTRPVEYAQLCANKEGVVINPPSTSDVSNWAGFTVFVQTAYKGTLIPQALDQQVYNNGGHHINMWFASIPYYPQTNGFAPKLWGCYAASSTAFKCITNIPQQGYASFSFTDRIGDVEVGINDWYSHAYNGNTQQWVDEGGQLPLPNSFILVYNVNAFKTFLNSMSAQDLNSFLVNHLFVLAECNLSTSKV